MFFFVSCLDWETTNTKLKAHNHLLTKILICQFTLPIEHIYNPNINLSKIEPLKSSHSGDIGLLVFKISKEAVKQPCLDQKIQCLFSKYSYFLCIF